eukprot:Phypoly_transcript_27750.p1 GENE.Phypoly_transcript_27750~~Phypoly_transcript_27750.p1  ORF type:complete len:102 (+),score=15.06 Phypoly_transcript_27750:88-393(+)
MIFNKFKSLIALYNTRISMLCGGGRKKLNKSNVEEDLEDGWEIIGTSPNKTNYDFKPAVMSSSPPTPSAHPPPSPSKNASHRRPHTSEVFGSEVVSPDFLM